MERKLDVLVEFWGGGSGYCDVWIDKVLKDKLESLPGVASIWPKPFYAGCYSVKLDPRYDEAELAAAIEGLGLIALPSELEDALRGE